MDEPFDEFTKADLPDLKMAILVMEATSSLDARFTEPHYTDEFKQLENVDVIRYMMGFEERNEIVALQKLPINGKYEVPHLWRRTMHGENELNRWKSAVKHFEPDLNN